MCGFFTNTSLWLSAKMPDSVHSRDMPVSITYLPLNGFAERDLHPMIDIHIPTYRKTSLKLEYCAYESQTVIVNVVVV